MEHALDIASRSEIHSYNTRNKDALRLPIRLNATEENNV